MCDKSLADPYFMFANLRFAIGLVVVVAVAFHGWTWARRTDASNTVERPLSTVLYVVFATALLILLSVESYHFCLDNIDDFNQSRWSARMSVSIVWSVFALALLLFGFRRQLRAVRIAALGLFGLTAVKLILLDLAGQKQIYRIISFVALGLLMIGASYLYHRVEKRLEKTTEGGKP